MEIIQNLQMIPLFQDVSPETYQELDFIASCVIKNYDPDCVIHFQNEKCTHMEIILSGIVSVEALDASGSSMIISKFSAGEILGSNLMFSSRPQFPMLVTAESEVSIIRVSKELILRLCTLDSDFLAKYLQQISDKALVLTGKINSVALKSIRQAVIEYLLLEQKYQKSNTIRLPFSKKEWAEMLGVQRPSLSRELNCMRQEGLIDFHNREIEIKNIEV